MRIFYLLIMTCILFNGTLGATNGGEQIMQDSIDIPKAFLMGEYEKEFELMIQSHETLLLDLCENDMEVAYEKWMSMLKEMEAYSEIVDYDLKGIKMWLNVFWSADGTIDHIAYYLKPNSRNIDTSELTLFFISFMNNYKLPLVATVKYSHYGTAAFPTMPRRVKIKDATEPKTDKLAKDSVESNN